MPSRSFCVLLVGPDPADLPAVSAMLAGADGPAFALEYAGSLLSALDCLSRGGVDIVLLDIFLPDSRGLETLLTVRAHAPEVPVLVWTSLESPQLAHGAVQAGAQDYLIKDRLNAAALVRALEYAILRHGTAAPVQAPRPESVTVGLVGAKGGVGTTMLACHLSAELRRLTGQPVLLADLDLYAGQVAFLMKAAAGRSILDAAQNLHRLDKEYWAALVENGAGGVSVIRSPGLPEMTEAPKTDRLRHVFRFLRSQYRWIVMDLGRVNALSLEMAADLNCLLLVTAADVQTLLETRQILTRLAAAGLPAGRLRLVLNRSTSRALVTQSETEKILGQPFYAALPNSYGALSEAYAAGQLLPEAANLRQHIASLAARIAGVEDPLKCAKPSLLGFLRKGNGMMGLPQPSYET